jgi:hypothetical protein
LDFSGRPENKKKNEKEYDIVSIGIKKHSFDEPIYVVDTMKKTTRSHNETAMDIFGSLRYSSEGIDFYF